MRPLTPVERAVLRRFADKLHDGERDRLLEDVDRSTARAATPDGSRIVFEIEGYVRPPYRGQRAFDVEGRARDRDGTELTVVLHADENGRLLELEVIRWDDGDVIGPDWGTLRLE